MRPKAGNDSNSNSGLFTERILSDVRQHPGQSGAAADEAADSCQRSPPEPLRERFTVGCRQQKCAAVRRMGQDVQGRRTRFGHTVIENLAPRGRTRLFPLGTAQGAVVVDVEARQQPCLILLPLTQ